MHMVSVFRYTHWVRVCSWYALGTVRSLHTLYCAVLHVAALRKCRTFVHHYCSVEMFIKNLILPILVFWVKCTAHFACIIFFLFTAYFAKNSASKFCQGLYVEVFKTECTYHTINFVRSFQLITNLVNFLHAL